jgi:hypothetical protein
MLSLVLIVIITANVILWNYQMNQYDWEKSQEKTEITNVEHITRSSWFTAKTSYMVDMGSYISGTYTDTWSVDDIYERFREELVPLYYNPCGYILDGATKYVSGGISDLATNNGARMIFKSCSSAFSPRALYAHAETLTIAGTSYYQLRANSADVAGTSLSADASSTGRKLHGRFVYSLTGITEIPASNWTLFYRAYKTGPITVAHCDVDILIRQANGNVRTTISSNVANSPNLGTSWSTVSATYSWSRYVVEDETDYLEIDYYGHVTTSQANRLVDLRIDDNTLQPNLQTRTENLMLPSQYTAQIELFGASNTQNWGSLTWTVDSAFSTDNVNVALQVYNYNTSQYLTSGDGYISYTSSPVPGTDETKNQTITINPTHYRNATGDWKIRITGVKTTTAQFNLSADCVEFQVTTQSSYRLDFKGEFAIDLSTYSLSHIDSIEIQIRYRVSDSLENWYLKAYNWTNMAFSDAGFNSTTGSTPSIGFQYYSVNLTSTWQSYINNNGTMQVKFCDNAPDSNQTTIDVDFFGVRAVIDGTKFSLKNTGAVTAHVVSVWVIDATIHSHYDANFFINSGDSGVYIRVDIKLPSGQFKAKIITERGYTAVFQNS